MIVAIDFDGTIVDHQFPQVGRPVPGAVPWMKRFQKLGARLVLWTMRSDGREGGFNPLAEAVEYCRAKGVEFWSVNGNPEQGSWTQSPKCYAHVYIDDAAYGCPLLPPRKGFHRPVVNWSVVGPAVARLVRNMTR